MTMVNISHVTFGWPASASLVFEDLSVQLDTEWKLGLIGRNGRGKSTLLQLLCGTHAYQGTITAAKPCVYFPCPIQNPNLPAYTILKNQLPHVQDWLLERELNQLKLSPALLEQSFSTLSGGEQTKLLLAALFLQEGCWPLLDEPTNHLDLQGRAVVSEYLSHQQGFLLVSHDRTFLDGCIDHICSIEKKKVIVQKGNYSSWAENKDREDLFETAQHEKLEKEAKRLKEAAKRTSVWADKTESDKHGTRNSGLRPDRGYLGHKSAKLQKRSKTVQARREKALAKKTALLQNLEEAPEITLNPLPIRANHLVEIRDLSISYGKRTVCQLSSLCIAPGERIALTGNNGSGKSSLLKLLCGEPIVHTGTVHLCSGLTLSYLPQDTSFLKGSLQAYAEHQQLNLPLFLAILRKLGFPREQFENDMKNFSAGQRKKVLLAQSLCTPAHLYLWDEPLNYMDILSRVQIEHVLLSAKPTMLFVEHDQTFLKKTATRVLHF